MFFSHGIYVKLSFLFIELFILKGENCQTLQTLREFKD